MSAAPKTINPKILFLDIEILPIIAEVWGIWKVNVGLNQIVKDWTIVSWAARWTGEKKCLYMDTRKRRDPRDDKIIVKHLWKLIDEADIVIAQNGDRFDIKKINARFIFHGMQPPSSYQTRDTLKIAKKIFGFTSNRMDFMAKYLDIGEKFSQRPEGYTGHQLWTKCGKRDPKAFKVMQKYNIQDVDVLIRLWGKLAPWAKGCQRINLNVFQRFERDECTRPNCRIKDCIGDHYICQCGSENIVANGYWKNNQGKWLRWRCKDCGSEFRQKGKDKNLRPQKRTGV